MASNEAFRKQAEGTSAAAQSFIEENEALQEVMTASSSSLVLRVV